ncbi:hypothetical protein ACH3XW_17905 [Acanthocheilonema viteae]
MKEQTTALRESLHNIVALELLLKQENASHTPNCQIRTFRKVHLVHFFPLISLREQIAFLTVTVNRLHNGGAANTGSVVTEKVLILQKPFGLSIDKRNSIL